LHILRKATWMSRWSRQGSQKQGKPHDFEVGVPGRAGEQVKYGVRFGGFKRGKGRSMVNRK
jgi:hypothetical protein